MLPHDSKARRLFVTSGGLKKIQEIKAEPGSILQEYINNINSCYPEEIVRWGKLMLGSSISQTNVLFPFPCPNVDIGGRKMAQS